MSTEPRRKFYELADLARAGKAPPAPLAVEAVRQIDTIFAHERDSNGRAAADRLAYRHEHAAPLVRDLEAWMKSERAKLSRHADVARAMDYMLKRWPAFIRFLDDGRICLTTDGVEKRDCTQLIIFAWSRPVGRAFHAATIRS